MAADYKQKIEELIFMASLAKPAYKAQPLLQQAIDIAQRHQDELLLFESKAQLMMACFKSGLHDKSLAIFPSIKFYSENKPENINPEAMMVFYMSVINGITEFPEISRAHVEAVLKEVEGFYAKHGYSLKEAYRLSSHAYLEMGDKTSADVFFEKSENAASGPVVHHCAACNMYSEITYLDHFGNYKAAIRQAQPLINGDLLCNLRQQVPYAALLLSYVNEGHWEEAIESYNRAWQVKHTMDYDHLWYSYKFMFFQVITRNLEKAIHSFEQSIERATKGHAWALTFLFYLSARFLFRHLERDGHQSISLKIPDTCPFYQASGSYSTTSLTDWFHSEITRLEKAFNKRNNNLFFSDLNKRHAEMEQLIAKEKMVLDD